MSSSLDDVDLLQLIGQDHSGIAIGRQIPGLDLDLQRLCVAVAELLHDGLRLGDVLFGVGTIAGQRRHHFRRHAPLALGLGQHRPAHPRQALHQDGIEGLAVQRQRHRLSNVRVVERRVDAVDHQIDLRSRRRHLADRMRRARLHVLHQGNADVGGKGDVVIAGGERQHARGAAVDHPERDLVEIRTILLPVIGIAHQTNQFAALEFDEFERPGADRLGAHHLLRHMAGIDRRKRARQQHRQAGLRLAQFERRLIIAVDGDVLQLGVPDLARIAVKVLGHRPSRSASARCIARPWP